MDALCEIHKLKNHAAEVQNIMLLKYLLTQIYVTASGLGYSSVAFRIKSFSYSHFLSG